MQNVFGKDIHYLSRAQPSNRLESCDLIMAKESEKQVGYKRQHIKGCNCLSCKLLLQKLVLFSLVGLVDKMQQIEDQDSM